MPNSFLFRDIEQCVATLTQARLGIGPHLSQMKKNCPDRDLRASEAVTMMMNTVGFENRSYKEWFLILSGINPGGPRITSRPLPLCARGFLSSQRAGDTKAARRLLLGPVLLSCLHSEEVCPKSAGFQLKKPGHTSLDNPQKHLRKNTPRAPPWHVLWHSPGDEVSGPGTRTSTPHHTHTITITTHTTTQYLTYLSRLQNQDRCLVAVVIDHESNKLTTAICMPSQQNSLEQHSRRHQPVNSCTAPRRHGRTTHQPEDVPYGGYGPDLPCHPPLSHGSSVMEVDDRRTRKVPSSPQVGNASLFKVTHSDLCAVRRHRVASVRTVAAFTREPCLKSTLGSTNGGTRHDPFLPLEIQWLWYTETVVKRDSRVSSRRDESR